MVLVLLSTCYLSKDCVTLQSSKPSHLVFRLLSALVVQFHKLYPFSLKILVDAMLKNINYDMASTALPLPEQRPALLCSRLSACIPNGPHNELRLL